MARKDSRAKGDKPRGPEEKKKGTNDRRTTVLTEKRAPGLCRDRTPERADGV